MRTKKAFVRFSLCFAFGFSSAVAESAGVVLRSETFLKICKIEVSKGTHSRGADNKIVFSGPIEKGWSYETHDGDYLCYRRSSDPANCWSQLSDYRCLTWTADGQISMPLQ
jgi:hypothetical protein